MFSTEAFAVLELDPNTATVAEIKKAYSSKLKVTRPEDDRESFMQLREAYTVARDHARYAETVNAPAEPDLPQDLPNSVQDLIVETPAQADTTDRATEEGQRPVNAGGDEDEEEDWRAWLMPPVAAAMRDLGRAIEAPESAAPVSAWKEVLGRDALQPLEELFQLDEQVRQFICDSTGLYEQRDHPKSLPWLTEEMVLLLDDHFGWSRHFGHHVYERQQYEWLHKIIATYRPLELPEQVFGNPVRSTPAPSKSEKLVLWLLKPLNLLLAYLGFRLIQTVLRII